MDWAGERLRWESRPYADLVINETRLSTATVHPNVANAGKKGLKIEVGTQHEPVIRFMDGNLNSATNSKNVA